MHYFISGAIMVLYLLKISACYEHCTELNKVVCRNMTNVCDRLCIDNECEIRAAVILPNNTDLSIAPLSQVVPFLERAISDAHKTHLLPEWLKITLIPKDDRCDASYAQIAMIESYANTSCVHVIFGPVCEYCLASVSRIVKFFGKPLLTGGGFTHHFHQPKRNCSHEYYMLVRTGVLSFKGLAEFFKLIVESYGWRKILLLYEKEGQNEVAGEHTCSLMMQTLIEELRNVPRLQYTDGDLGLSTLNISEFLKQKVGVNHAIIVMCASNYKIRQILLAAAELGSMISNGEYIFFNIELINKAKYPSTPWINSSDTPDNNKKLENAYKAVITLTSYAEEIPNESGSYEIKSRTNYTSGFYDAMTLYIKAISKFIKPGGKPNNTQTILNPYELVNEMFGTTFEGLNGEVDMNCNGDRKNNYSLISYNKYKNKFDIVAYYNQGGKNFTFVNGKRIHWPSGLDVAPPDVPICGYDNSKCQKQSIPGYAYLSASMVGIAVLIVIYTVIKRRKLETDIYLMAWKVHWGDVVTKENPNISERSMQPLLKTASRTINPYLNENINEKFENSGEMVKYELLNLHTPFTANIAPTASNIQLKVMNISSCKTFSQ